MTGRDCHGISDTGMNPQELAGYLDELIFSSTGKHIDSLQLAILKGVLNGQKYADIAKEYSLRVTPKMKLTNSGNFFRIR